MKTLLTVAALGAAVFALGVVPAGADAPARVIGKVVDASSSAPVKASVWIADEAGRSMTVRTDRTGRFTALGLDPGNVTVTFAAPGFEPQAMTCPIPAGEAGRFDFRALRSNSTEKAPHYRCRLDPDTSDRTTIQ